jgi:hypothetical protein
MATNYSKLKGSAAGGVIGGVSSVPFAAFLIEVLIKVVPSWADIWSSQNFAMVLASTITALGGLIGTYVAPANTEPQE